MNKELIQKRFAKNLKTYNENAYAQERMAKKILNILPKRHYGRVLEIGCGAGLLTNLLIKEITFDKYIANDIVKECFQYIKNISSDIAFKAGDVSEFVNNCDEKFDLIISNATFQWVENIEVFIGKLHSMLNPNGILLFSTFGKKNYIEISNITGNSLNYYSVEEYEDMLKIYDGYIEEDLFCLNFETALDVLKHLKFTGVNAISENLWTKKDLINFQQLYKKQCPDSLILTYNPFFIKIKK